MIELSRRRVLHAAIGAASVTALASTLGACDTEDSADPELRERGRWKLLGEHLQMVPIHAAVLHTGDVLFWGPDLTQDHEDVRSHHAFDNINDMAQVRLALLNSASYGVRYPPMRNPRNMFCAGQTLLPSGDVLVAGGHAYPGPDGDGVLAEHKGADRDIHVYDPATYLWDRRTNMEISRWYPTCVQLADGQVLIVSGFSAGVPPNPSAVTPLGPPLNATYDLFDSKTNQLRTEQPRPWLLGWHVPFGPQTLYPFVKLMPGGSLFVHDFNTTRIWSPGGRPPLGMSRIETEYESSNSTNYRTYPGQGACVVLPLNPADPHVRILVAGGGDEARTDVNHTTRATNTAEIFDYYVDRDPLAAATGWRPVAEMHHRRFMSDAVLLPDGNVFLVGGSGIGKADDNSEPILEPEMFNPVDETWTTMPTHEVPRRYHSVAVCLPNGRVLCAGSTGSWPHAPWPLDDRHPGTYPEYRVETYSPGYLFRGPRPVIATAPTSAGYGQQAQIVLGAGADVVRATLLRPCAVTHTNDMSQRHLELEITHNEHPNLTVRLPPDGTWAPPGWYMLFTINAAGVPSQGHFLNLS